jgi:AcrR family transcriptional regulator
MATRAPKRQYAPRLPPGERREQLLDAALKVIDEHGYGGVSMEAIAREAGVTKPVVYDLFGNRGELLMALLEREEARALSQVGDAMPDDLSADPDELVVDGFRKLLGAVVENPATWRLIVLPADSTPEVVREHVESGRAGVRERIAQLIGWGVEARGGPAEVDYELAAQALVALGEHLIRLVLTDPDRFTIDRVSGFMGGLLAAMERPSP